MKGIIKPKISIRIDESDLLVIDELIELFGLNLSVVIQTILKVYLKSICNEQGDIKESIKNAAKEFSECKGDGSDSEELPAPQELDD